MADTSATAFIHSVNVEFRT